MVEDESDFSFKLIFLKADASVIRLFFPQPPCLSSLKQKAPPPLSH